MPRPSSKLVKTIVLEFLQWCAFSSVVFVTAQKLALSMKDQYSVLIAGSVGYVAGTTLILWIPVKLAFQWKKLLTFHEKEWCPSMLIYVFLGALPCCVISIVGISYDSSPYYESVCAELMVAMLVVVDIAEKLKHYKLRSDANNSKSASDNNLTSGQTRNRYSMVPSTSSYDLNQKQKFSLDDPRTTALLESMLNVYDVRLILGSLEKNNNELMTSNWSTAIYIVAFVAMLSFILTPNSRYKFVTAVILLDIPLFFVRLAIICVYGYITDALFMFKNILSFSFCLYFCFLRPVIHKPKPSNKEITVNTVEFVDANNDARHVRESSFYDHRSSNEYYDRSRGNTFEEGYQQQDTHVQHYDEGYYDAQHHQYDQSADHHSQSEEPTYYRADDLNQTQQHDVTNSLDYTTHQNDVTNPPDDKIHHDDATTSQNYDETNVHADGTMPIIDPYHVHRVSRKVSVRPSIVKEDVFRSAEEEPATTKVQELTSADASTTTTEPTYARVKKPSSRYRKSAPSPPKALESNAQKKNDGDDDLPDPPENVSLPFPSPPLPEDINLPRFKEYKVGPHRISVRNNRYTPKIAAELAKEVVANIAEHQDENYNDPLDVKL